MACPFLSPTIPPGGFPLPIDQGAPIYIRALEETDGTRGEGRALLARAEDGRLLAALSDNMILPSNAMMDGFLVSPADTLTYSEVRRPDGICEVVREHTEVKISFGGTAAQLETGKWMRLFHEDNIYRVLAIESYTEVENNCDTPGRSAFGFAVLAMD